MSWHHASIVGSEASGPGLRWMRLQVPQAVALSFRLPGQFVRIRVGGFDAHFAIASAPGSSCFEFFVRTNGDAAQAWSALPLASIVEITLADGPGFPIDQLKGRDLLLVGTGTGWAPLRSVVLAVRKRRSDFKRVDGLYGVLTPEHIVFEEEFVKLKADQIDVRVTVTEPIGTWAGPIGRVQALLPADQLVNTTALLVGQPEMTAEVTSMLVSRGLSPAHAWLNF
jgi:sulfhydrogenase subunit gamma (sulfur reductase)